MRPHFKREKAHGGRVAGVDEVGRGPLAGPVLAVALVFPNGVPRRVAPLIDDSKKLTHEQRHRAALAIRGCADIGVGAASVAEIARLNILHAAMLAMTRAVRRLPIPPDLALIDGNRLPPDLPCPAEPCIGGDATSLSIAAASIIAKQLRDHAMTRLGVRYPAYGWDENAGYATPSHRAALRTHGPCRHHRETFGTVRVLLDERDPSMRVPPALTAPDPSLLDCAD